VIVISGTVGDRGSVPDLRGLGPRDAVARMASSIAYGSSGTDRS
jgi:hypothetical protein